MLSTALLLLSYRLSQVFQETLLWHASCSACYTQSTTTCLVTLAYNYSVDTHTIANSLTEVAASVAYNLLATPSAYRVTMSVPILLHTQTNICTCTIPRRHTYSAPQTNASPQKYAICEDKTRCGEIILKLTNKWNTSFYVQSHQKMEESVLVVVDCVQFSEVWLCSQVSTQLWCQWPQVRVPPTVPI